MGTVRVTIQEKRKKREKKRKEKKREKKKLSSDVLRNTYVRYIMSDLHD